MLAFQRFTMATVDDSPHYRLLAKFYWGIYHLHGKTGNSGWKNKWLAPFRLGNFKKYGLWFEAMQFFYSIMSMHKSSPGASGGGASGKHP